MTLGKRLKAYGKLQKKRYRTILRAYMRTSCRKFDQFGDWYFVRKPGVVFDLFARKQAAADAFYYDFKE